jgi:hypothetical protein
MGDIMSITPDKIEIPIVGMGVVDKTRAASILRKELHAAILRGFSRAVEAVVKHARKIVPESIKRKPAYPRSYESERMMLTYIADLERSLAKLSRGRQTLRTMYTIQEEWQASYTKYVNEMTSVKWSKTGSQSNFVEILHLMLATFIPLYIQEEIRKTEDLGMKALKYVGVS